VDDKGDISKDDETASHNKSGGCSESITSAFQVNEISGDKCNNVLFKFIMVAI